MGIVNINPKARINKSLSSKISVVTGGSGGIPEAPIDGKLYGRKDADWSEVPPPTTVTGPTVIYGEIPIGVIDGVNQDFTTAYAYSPNQLIVFLNGLRQRRVNDYTETGTRSFSLADAPLPGDSLSIDYTLF